MVRKASDERGEQKTISTDCLLARRDSRYPALRGRRRTVALGICQVADRAPCRRFLGDRVFVKGGNVDPLPVYNYLDLYYGPGSELPRTHYYRMITSLRAI